MTAVTPVRGGPVGRLRSIVDRDLDALDSRLGGPHRGVIVLVAAVIVGFAVGFGRLSAPVLYTESVPFMVTALLFGVLARTPGMALWAGFVLGDAMWVADRWGARPYDWPTDVLLGRLGGDLYLWVLVVTCTGMSRTAAYWVALRRTFRDRLPASATIAAALVNGAALGVLTYSWASFAPYIANGAILKAPSSALYTVQGAAPTLAAVSSVVAAALWPVFRARSGPAGDLVHLFASAIGWSPTGIVVRLLAISIMLVMISGLVSGPLDLGILFAGVLVGEVFALVVHVHRGVGRMISRLPLAVRLATIASAPLVVTGFSLSAFAAPSAPAPATPFLPMILVFATAYMIGRPLLAPYRAEPPSAALIGIPPAALGAIVGLTVWLASPEAAWADDCTGFKHCADMLIGAAIFGALMAPAIIAGLLGDLGRNVEDMLTPPPYESPSGGWRQGPFQERPSVTVPGTHSESELRR